MKTYAIEESLDGMNWQHITYRANEIDAKYMVREYEANDITKHYRYRQVILDIGF